MEDETIRIVPRNAPQAIVWIRVVGGPHRGSEWSFQHATTATLGRGMDANLRLPNEAFLSRVHCEFRIAPPHISVRDLSQCNGLSINGIKVLDATLHHGDTISTGETSIQIHVVHAASKGDSKTASDSSSSPILVQPTHDATKTRMRDGPAEPIRPAGPVMPRTSVPDNRVIATELHEPAQTAGNSSTSESLPERIGPYRVIKLAGRGGMGVVYQAEHVGNKRLVAIKLLSALARGNENQSSYLQEKRVC